MIEDRRGNVALMFGLLAPVLLAFVGAGVDYARYNSIRDSMQDIADFAALAGARQYSIAAGAAAVPVSIAQQIADAGLAANDYGVGAIATISANIPDTSVTVAITQTITPTFLIGIFKNPLEMEVDATAQAVGGANICVIALEENSTNALLLDSNAQLSGDDCAVYSNSNNNKGLVSKSNAIIKSVLTCTAGGYDGGVDNFDPSPLTDCPPREDPLIDRQPPPVGACSPVPNLVIDITTTLSPGVYCGGLTIGGNAIVVLTPGVYVIKDGNLTIDSNASMAGEGVGFYFAGADSVFTATSNATIDLTAPIDGPMAGLLMFQDRNANQNGKFEIASNNAETLVGTIYLPNGRFYVDADNAVAAASAYTAIIAQKIELNSSANLVLNSDYQATDVPVPAGIANAGGSVRLRE